MEGAGNWMKGLTSGESHIRAEELGPHVCKAYFPLYIIAKSKAGQTPTAYEKFLPLFALYQVPSQP